jgi:signal transduction histidine kinase
MTVRARLTARGRLTLLHTALVLAAGLVLTALTYYLMRQRLERRRYTQIAPGDTDLPADATTLPDLAQQTRDATLNDLLTQAAIALAVVTLLAAVLGWLVAGRVLRPIRVIAATTRRLSTENLSERVPVTAPADELAALAVTINGMLDRIQDGIAERDRVLASQRMFTANAAHELRTPLTTMRTAIDVTLDGDPNKAELLTMAGDIRTAVGHSQHTLDGLLALARSQASPSEWQPVNLADLAASALHNVADRPTDHHITLRRDLRPAPVNGKPVLLERMIANLLDNATRYNHPGGHVEITTNTTATTATLRVTNTGPPITPTEADRLTQPFVRGENLRTHTDSHTHTGAGLGLSIVHAIVHAHHGEITLTPRPAGGLDITIHLPLTPPGSG